MACPSVRRLHRAPLFGGARSASSQALVRTEQTQHRLSLLQRHPLEVNVLSNGVRVVTQRRSDVGSVSVGLFRKGGSEQETRATNGISGFLQRIQQRGTTKHSAAALCGKVAGINGRVHTVNERQYNGTLFRSPKEHVAENIALLAGMACNPALNKDDIEAERASTLRTLQATQLDPEACLYDYLHDVAFQGTTLSLSPLGNTDGINSITQESLANFARDSTVGENLCLAVVGDVEHAEVMEAAEKHLQSIPAGKSVEFLPIRYSGSHVNVRDDDMGLCYTAIGFEAPAYGNADSLAMEAVRHICGQYDRSCGADARHGLVRAAYDAHQWDYNVYAYCFKPFAFYYGTAGLFGTYIISHNPSQEASFSYVSQDWHRIRHRCREADVDRAKCEMKAELALNTESTSGQVELMGKQLMTLGRAIPLHEMDQRIDNLHADFVRTAMDEYFYDTDPVYAEMGHCETELDYHVVRRMMYLPDLPDQ
ncbi:uncharacterized protein LOC135809492 [Sycon ciliatum]|uniref:uncharacterized protein LOC135809492 n=1 Tax=Sycon ciliatum TaxID=27933 RepID=UPI0031F60B73